MTRGGGQKSENPSDLDRRGNENLLGASFRFNFFLAQIDALRNPRGGKSHE